MAKRLNVMNVILNKKTKQSLQLILQTLHLYFLRFQQPEKVFFLWLEDDFGIINIFAMIGIITAFPFILKFDSVKIVSSCENNLFQV